MNPEIHREYRNPLQIQKPINNPEIHGEAKNRLRIQKSVANVQIDHGSIVHTKINYILDNIFKTCLLQTRMCKGQDPLPLYAVVGRPFLKQISFQIIS